ncbi:MAG: DUF4430 domain-containing protein [Oscillospiraceae bacterium]|jgi:hypothetical protein|nr:DUF4430 domain-containing protein [Oscillospiraceae bacterium]
MKKILSLALALTLLLSLAGFALAEGDADGNPQSIAALSISLRIEGKEGSLFYEPRFVVNTAEQEITVADLVATFYEVERVPEFALTDSDYGPYISAIGGLAEYADGGMSGWQTRINGVSPAVGIIEQTVVSGDELVFYYSDQYGLGMQFPSLDDSQLTEGGVVRFVSEDTVYDENWNETVETNPVAGATVTWNGETYITEADGGIVLPPDALSAGWNAVQIERYDAETGVPTVLRFAPGYTHYTQFTDVAEGEWFVDAIKFATEIKFLKGMGQGFGTVSFWPNEVTTRAQLLQILSRIAEADAAGTGADWWVPAYQWAFALGIETADAEAFDPDAAVTRGEFFTLFYKLMESSELVDTSSTADISGAVDYDAIAEEDLDATAWAVAVGLIRGDSDDALQISPTRDITRAEVCQMLRDYYLGIVTFTA